MAKATLFIATARETNRACARGCNYAYSPRRGEELPLLLSNTDAVVPLGAENYRSVSCRCEEKLSATPNRPHQSFLHP